MWCLALEPVRAGLWCCLNPCGSSRSRRGETFYQGSQGFGHRDQSHRSEHEGWQWGNARCHHPPSLHHSGPAAGTSKLRRAGPPLPPLHHHADTPSLPQHNLPSWSAWGSTPCLKDTHREEDLLRLFNIQCAVLVTRRWWFQITELPDSYWVVMSDSWTNTFYMILFEWTGFGDQSESNITWCLSNVKVLSSPAQF